jgi:hypothetical protein
MNYRESEAEHIESHKFEREVLFVGLTDLNTGFDSDQIGHFSPIDFGVVIDRCAAMKVRINGIEVSRVSPGGIQCMDIEICPGDDYDWARKLVRKYADRKYITFCATFSLPDSLRLPI